MSQVDNYVKISCDEKGCKDTVDMPYDSTEELQAWDTKIHRGLTKEGWSFVERHYCPRCEKKYRANLQ